MLYSVKGPPPLFGQPLQLRSPTGFFLTFSFQGGDETSNFSRLPKLRRHPL